MLKTYRFFVSILLIPLFLHCAIEKEYTIYRMGFENDTSVNDSCKSTYEMYLRCKVTKLIKDKSGDPNYINQFIPLRSLPIDGVDEIAIKGAPLFTILATFGLYDLANQLLQDKSFQADSGKLGGNLYSAIFVDSARGNIGTTRQERIKILVSHGASWNTLAATGSGAIGANIRNFVAGNKNIEDLLTAKYPKKLYFDKNGNATDDLSKAAAYQKPVVTDDQTVDKLAQRLKSIA